MRDSFFTLCHDNLKQLQTFARIRWTEVGKKTVRGCTDKTRETEHIGNATNQQLVFFLSNQERNAK